MELDRVDTLLDRLRLHYTCVVSRTPKEYLGTVLDYPLPTKGPESDVHVMPRISNEVVKRIAKSSIDGNIDDMLTLSMMYGAGLGLPKNTTLSYAWACMSLMEPGPVGYKQAKKKLLSHIEGLDPTEFSYPRVVDKLFDTVFAAQKTVPAEKADKLPDGKYLLGPMLTGVQAYAMYRISEDGTAYLYDFRIRMGKGDEPLRISLDLAPKIDGVPVVFGEIRRKPTIVNYAGRSGSLFEIPPKALIVSGSLAVPNSIKPNIRSAHPECPTLSSLISKFVKESSMERVPYEPSEAFVQAKRQMDRLRETAKTAEGKERRRAKAKIAELAPGYKDLVAKEKEDKARFSARYPENVLKFIAGDIQYATSNSGVVSRMPLGRNVYQHLQSLGFDTFSHPMFDNYTALRTSDLGKKAVEKAIAEFSSIYSDFNVQAVIARPNVSSVNGKDSAFSYVIK